MHTQPACALIKQSSPGYLIIHVTRILLIITMLINKALPLAQQKRPSAFYSNIFTCHIYHAYVLRKSIGTRAFYSVYMEIKYVLRTDTAYL